MGAFETIVSFFLIHTLPLHSTREEPNIKLYVSFIAARVGLRYGE
jgi:hypothetical protein